MKKVLKGFTDYADYQGYAEILLGWYTPDQHKLLYKYLLSVQDKKDPVTLMRKMKVDAQVEMMKAKEA
jgi:hypothetical protein